MIRWPKRRTTEADTEAERRRKRMRELGSRGGKKSAEVRAAKRREAEEAAREQAGGSGSRSLGDLVRYVYSTGNAALFGLPETQAEIDELIAGEGEGASQIRRNPASSPLPESLSAAEPASVDPPEGTGSSDLGLRDAPLHRRPAPALLSLCPGCQLVYPVADMRDGLCGSCDEQACRACRTVFPDGPVVDGIAGEIRDGYCRSCHAAGLVPPPQRSPNLEGDPR